MITALHKFYKLEDYKEANEKYNLDTNYFMVSTGISDIDFENLKEIVNNIECKLICIDIANGYISSFVQFCKKVRDEFPDKIIVAGNVVTRGLAGSPVIQSPSSSSGWICKG